MAIKEIAIALGICGSLIGVGLTYQKTADTAVHAEETVQEVKTEVKENREINVQQTVALTILGENLKQVAKTLDKVEKKLDK